MTLQIPERSANLGVIGASGSELGDPHLGVCDSCEPAPRSAEENLLGPTCDKPAKSDDMTDFMTLTTEGLKKSVGGTQTGTRTTPFPTWITLEIFWSNFHMLLFSFFLHPEDKKTFCSIRSCSWQISKPQ